MDKKLIQQFGTDILCYRIRPARHKVRMQYEDLDKHLIQLDKEERQLWRRRVRLGWEPLIPPFQKGWNRSFVLREDVAASKDTEFFQGILNKINTCHWSHQKNFRIKKRRLGRKYYVVKPQKLRDLSPFEFRRQAFTDREQTYFDIEYRYHPWKWYPGPG